MGTPLDPFLTMKHYLQFTSSPWYSYVFVLPLLVLYQLAAVLANLGSERRIVNGADALIQSALRWVGVRGWLGSWIVLAVIAGVVVYRLDIAHHKGPLRTSYFPMMLAESAVYALIFGTVVGVLTSLVLPGLRPLQIGAGELTFGQKLATSLGAGLYEELFFRLLLTGGLLALFHHLGWSQGTSVLVAVLGSSFIFSLFHYIGTYADTFTLASFVFRFIAGLMLAVLFSTRGFAVAAWTHALYDVFLLCSGKG